MLTVIPINPYKAKATGNLEIKGIPTKGTRCSVKKWDLKVNKSVQCSHRANFVISNTKPIFKYGNTRYRFAGIANTLTLFCAFEALEYINSYKAALQSRIMNLEHGYSYNIRGEQRPEKTKKMLKTKAQNELNKIDNLVLLVHRLMKKDKNIAMDLMEV